jgi:hypothetical protein
VYYQVLQAILVNYCPSFYIHFHSVVVTPTTVLMVGDASTHVNWLREIVRREMGRAAMALMEPYKSNIIHATLVRFARPLNPTQLAELVQWSASYQQVHLGTLHVTSLHVSSATWLMRAVDLNNVHVAELC